MLLSTLPHSVVGQRCILHFLPRVGLIHDSLHKLWYYMSKLHGLVLTLLEHIYIKRLQECPKLWLGMRPSIDVDSPRVAVHVSASAKQISDIGTKDAGIATIVSFDAIIITTHCRGCILSAVAWQKYIHLIT